MYNCIVWMLWTLYIYYMYMYKYYIIVVCDVICRYPDHEERVEQLARELGFTHVSLSSHVMPMVRAVQRGFTGS